MKTARRVRHHAGTKPTSLQSGNAPINPSGKTNVTLGPLRETPSGYTGRIAFSGDIYLALGILAATKHAGDWNAALCDLLGSSLLTASKPEPFPLPAFESAIQDAGAAIDALLNKVIADNDRSASPAISGYKRLAQSAQKSLSEAFHGVHETLYSPAKAC